MSEEPLSVEQIAHIFNAEVLCDEETTEVLERAELARQADFVRGWNRSVGVKAQEPDEATAEVLRDLESDGVVEPGQTYEQALSLLAAARDDVTDSNPLLAGVRNGKWLDEQHFEPLEYAVPGVVPEGLSLLAGAPKIGKSWLGLSWALAVACGGKALGRIDVGEPRPTLYLALEDGDRRLQDRCRRLLEGDPIPEGFDYITRVEPGLVLDTLQAWLDLHGDGRPLVTLDTLGKVMPPALQGETTYGRDYRVGSALHALSDEYPGSSLLVNHHDRKAAASDFVASVSGTNGLAGAADTVIVLNRARHETTGRLKVTGRDVAEDEYAVTFTNGAVWALDGADLEAAAAKAQQDRVTAGLGDRSAEVAAFVLARPEGARAADVVAGLGLDRNTVTTYLARLADAGRIVRASRGLYTHPVTSVTSVTSDDDDY